MAHNANGSFVWGGVSVKKHGPTQRYGRQLHVEALESRRLLSAVPTRLDIGPNDSSSVSGVVDVGGVAFFAAPDGAHGQELWKSDGTPAGTVLIKDIAPGGASSNPDSLTNISGTLYFTADDGTHGRELWKSDGTEAGTVLVKDIVLGSDGANPGSLANINGTLFFSTNGGNNGYQLWKSNGTEAGTTLVKAGVWNSWLGGMTNVGGTLFFTADDSVHGRELWKSNGTEAGTTLVRDIRPDASGDYWLAPNYLTNVNGTLFFTADDLVNGRELWRSDGTQAGTVLVKDIWSGSSAYYPYGPNSSNPGALTNLNGTLFFRATDAIYGTELWKSDGTETGTVLVEDISPGSNPFGPGDLTNVNGTLFFQAYDGVNGYELWKSDGTESGTVLVKDIRPGDMQSNSQPRYLTNVNGTLFFTANDGIHGYELWKSDGTEAGTVLVKDMWSGSSSSFSGALTNVNGTLFFTADDGIHGRELWKSDGTDPGTAIVHDFNTVNSWSSDPDPFTNVGGVAFFAANDPTHGRELWKSDGTQSGTVLVKDINPGSASSNPGAYGNLYTMADVNGTLFFLANDGTTGFALWKSDGTEAGTVMVKNISASALTNVNGTLFFYTVDAIHGAELWKSDGTAAGTVLVKDICPGSGSSSPGSLTNVNGLLFFAANDGIHGFELWKSDGTETGTVMIKDANPHSQGSFNYSGRFATGFTNVNGTLFFQSIGDLWKSDGTEAGTLMIKDIYFSLANLTNVNGSLFFTAYDDIHGEELWKSDGTEAGTTIVKDIFPGGGGETFANSQPTHLTSVGGTLFFQANDGVHGRELWKSDGTEAGTMLVKDIRPGSENANVISLTNVNGTLFFTVDDGIHGNELWKSDGTEAGTVIVQDIRPGSDGSVGYGIALTNANGTLIFSANDGISGTDPWLLRVSSSVVDQHLFYKGSTKWNVTNGATFSDDNAIAPDKSAYLPGSGTSAYSAISNYTKGINGLMVDLAGAHGTITADDFIFKVGNNNSPSAWTTAPAPTSVTVRSGAGAGGSDRVELMWADNAIQKQWLEVIVKGNDALGGSNTNTGLASSYVFYFGSAIGDSGAGNSGAFQVTSSDEINARGNPKTFTATRSDVNDFNRDGSVNSSDQILARSNVTNLANQLKFLVVGAGGPFAPESWGGGEAAAGAAEPLAVEPLSPSVSSAGTRRSGGGSDAIGFATALSTNLSTPAFSQTASPMTTLQNTDARNPAAVRVFVQQADDDATAGPARLSSVVPMTAGLDVDDGLLDLLVAGRLQTSLS